MNISATNMANIPAVTGTHSVRKRMETLLNFKVSWRYSYALLPNIGTAYSDRNSFENQTA